MDKSTQKQLKEENESKLERKLKEAKDEELKSKKLQHAVRQLPRVPGSCPVTKCSEIVFPSNLMMHILHKHAQSIGGSRSDVFEHKPHIMAFDPLCYNDGSNHCMAAIMYGGAKGIMGSEPGLSYLSNPNTALINENHRYDNYLPIMVMVCRSTWYAQLKDKHLERQLVSLNSDRCHAGIYVFWLVAPKTTRKLYYTMTVFDRYYLNSRSVVRVVRDYTQTQNPSDFLPLEDNYLLLRDAEVENFMSMSRRRQRSDGRPMKIGIPIELIIYEDPKAPPQRHSTQKELRDALMLVKEAYAKEAMPRIKSVPRTVRFHKFVSAPKNHSKPETSVTDSGASRSSIYFS